MSDVYFLTKGKFYVGEIVSRSGLPGVITSEENVNMNKKTILFDIKRRRTLT